MNKKAQTSSLYAPQLAGKTLYDLYQAVMQDISLSEAQRIQTLQQLKGVTGGMPASTPISVLMTRGLGGIIGYLISKYFGMSPMGRVVGAAMGFGLGKLIHDQFNKPRDLEPPGWDLMG